MPTIDTDGTRMAYEDAGTGLPIVFIPGLVGAKEWFGYQFSGLGQKYRIISYDLREAHGLASYTLDVLTEDLARLVTSLRLHSAVIAGHSFGAMIAQRFAAMHPERVGALVLISGFPHLAGQGRDTLVESLSPGAVRAESTFRSLVTRLFRTKPPDPPEDVEGTEWLAAHGSRLSRATLAARIGVVEQFNSSEWLRYIEAPTLVLVGSQDRAPLLAAARMLYEAIPDSALEVVEDGDHFPFYTRHDIVNGTIDDFLTERLAGL